MRRLHIATAAIEAPVGVALLCCPSAVAGLLLGTGLDAPAAVAVGRVAGAAVLSLAVACWLARHDAQGRAARGLTIAMTLYNLGVAIILAAAGAGAHLVGIVLWPAVVLHAAMTVWCVVCLVRKPAQAGEGAI